MTNIYKMVASHHSVTKEPPVWSRESLSEILGRQCGNQNDFFPCIIIPPFFLHVLSFVSPTLYNIGHGKCRLITHTQNTQSVSIRGGIFLHSVDLIILNWREWSLLIILAIFRLILNVYTTEHLGELRTTKLFRLTL